MKPPRCCDRATLQWKSVRDCGAIQKNPKRCKNRTEFQQPRLLSNEAANPTDLGGHTRCGLPSAKIATQRSSATCFTVAKHVVSGLRIVRGVATGEPASMQPDQHLGSP